MSAQNTFNTTAGDDSILGSIENDLIDGLDGNDILEGGNGEDTLRGNNGEDSLVGGADNDILEGGQGSDTLFGGALDRDVFAYAGDPFEGQDVSAPGQQIIGGEDFIGDFATLNDTYRFNAADFDVDSDVNFTAVDANAEGASIAPGTNVVALLNGDDDNNPDTRFAAGNAANQIAELTSEDGAGFFAYFNSDLQQNRVVYSTNLNDANADLKIISRQTNVTGSSAVNILGNFSADNFEFEDVQLADGNGEGANEPIVGDANNNELFGTEGNDVIDGGEGNDLLFGDLSSDTITGGAGADIFAYAGDPFEGRDVSAPEREIIADNQDFISDFDFAEDKYRFNATDFDVDGDVNFAAVDANAEGASIAPGTNVVAVLNSNDANDPNAPFAAGTAANQIAELTSEDGAGFFAYFNSGLELNRVVYSTNLNDANADLNVISQQTDLTGQDAIDALNNFSADNFEFEDVRLGNDNQDTVAGELNPILGDAENNELIGTTGNDLINGREGNDTLFGDTGADTFVFDDNYLSGTGFDPDDIKITSSNADSITDFNIDEDRLSLANDSFLIDEIQFANLAAGDSISGANVVVLDEPASSPLRAVDEIFGSEAQLDSGVVIFADSSEENQVSAVRYSLVDDLFTARGGVVTNFDNLGFEDLENFTADNFTLDDASDTSFM